MDGGGKSQGRKPDVFKFMPKIKACSASRNEHGLKHINVFSRREAHHCEFDLSNLTSTEINPLKCHKPDIKCELLARDTLCIYAVFCPHFASFLLGLKRINNR